MAVTAFFTRYKDLAFKEMRVRDVQKAGKALGKRPWQDKTMNRSRQMHGWRSP